MPLSSEFERACALEVLTDPVFLMRPVRDPAGVVTDLVYGYVNSAAVRLYARPISDIVGHYQCELFPSVRELGILDRYITVLETGTQDEMEVPDFDENGVAGSFMLEIQRVGGDLLVVARDNTAQRRAERGFAEQAEHLRAVLDGSRDGVVRYSPDLTVEYVNHRVVELSGRPAEQWLGRTHAELGYGADDAASWDRHLGHVFETGAPVTFTYEVDNREGHGWWEASLAPEFDEVGSVAHVVSTNRDVTRRVLAEQRLQVLATHDALTGLANRVGLQADLARALRSAARSGRVTSVLMVDLDRFKFVNDSRGHRAGDRLLCAVGDRLRSLARAGDLIARPGGDEFVIVMRDLEGPAEAVAAAWRLVRAFRDPFATADGEFFATASIGLAVSGGGEAAEDLLRDADTAMYDAKSRGRDRVSVFNEDLRSAVSSRLRMEGDLRHALERGELAVWYQPEIDLASGELVAVEALLRWRHPSGETLTAERFIGIAEETGLILSIGAWVLRTACLQSAAWSAAEPDRRLTVRVNLSALQLEEASLLATLDGALADSGVDPADICAEITETAWLHGTDAVRVNLDGIRDRGMPIAIDDFGTGYASLTYLRRYPVSVLKIDQSFVAALTTSEGARRLVAGIVALAKAVGVDVTAEGVEQREQAEILRGLGCPTSQGFLYSGAVPPDEIAALRTVTYPHGPVVGGSQDRRHGSEA